MQTIVVEAERRPEEVAESLAKRFQTSLLKPVTMLCHVDEKHMVAFTVCPEMSVCEIESLIRDIRKIEFK